MARTVLVVDDVPFVRTTLSKILTEAHYQVIGEAENGEQAVELFLRLKPDVITMDVVMPVMSGIDAAREILLKHKEAKIIMVSAMGQESLIMEAINAGARDYILKPFNANDILKTLEHVFRASNEASKHRSARL